MCVDVPQAVKKPRAGLDHDEWLQRRAQELEVLTQEMMPDSESHGEHSWTKKAPTGAAIEVLLTKKAMYLKKYASGFEASAEGHTFSWKKSDSVAEAWARAKIAVGWG